MNFVGEPAALAVITKSPNTLDLDLSWLPACLQGSTSLPFFRVVTKRKSRTRALKIELTVFLWLLACFLAIYYDYLLDFQHFTKILKNRSVCPEGSNFTSSRAVQSWFERFLLYAIIYVRAGLHVPFHFRPQQWKDRKKRLIRVFCLFCAMRDEKLTWIASVKTNRLVEITAFDWIRRNFFAARWQTLVIAGCDWQ